jgi:hypothetical protein
VFIGDSWVGNSEMGGVPDNDFSRIVADHYNWPMDPSGLGGTSDLHTMAWVPQA